MVLLERLSARTAVGHSMGARTALDVAAERTDLLDVLVLEDPPLWPGAPSEELRAGDPLGDPAFTAVRRAISLPERERAAWAKTVTPGWTPTDRRAWVAALGNLSVEVFHPGAFAYSREWRATFEKLRTPTLLLRGEHGLATNRLASSAREVRDGHHATGMVGIRSLRLTRLSITNAQIATPSGERDEVVRLGSATVGSSRQGTVPVQLHDSVQVPAPTHPGQTYSRPLPTYQPA
jgi:pimeloyl-ACP methyl ester carboxylesterase